MSLDLPAVNTLVRVRCSRDGEVHRSRVEALGGPDLLVAAPHGKDDPALPYPNDRLIVAWGTVRGKCSLPVRFGGVETSRILVWRVTPDGEIELEQRRRSVRASATGKVTVVAGAGLVAPLTGPVVDVSETGLRCLLPRGLAGPGMPVDVRLDLGEESLEMGGEVLRVTSGSNEHDEVVVLLTPAPAQADHIRRFVYARQRHERRMGRW